jgi:hypothetical protein
MPNSTGDNTIFPKYEFNKTAYIAYCQAKFGLTPDFAYPLSEYGGMNVGRDFKDYSNIIFSNGELDPRMAGGVTEYITLKLPYYLIKGAAHYQDLRLPNAADSEDLIRVRNHEILDLQSWIDEY